MNVAILTFVRRGYLLTVLAVAVLLAGFSRGRRGRRRRDVSDYSNLKVFVVPQACCQRAQLTEPLSTAGDP